MSAVLRRLFSDQARFLLRKNRSDLKDKPLFAFPLGKLCIGFSLSKPLRAFDSLFSAVVLLTAKPRLSPMAARKPLREQFLNKVYFRTGVLPGGATAPPSSRRDLFRPSAILPAAKSAGLERQTAVHFPYGKARQRFFSLKNAMRF